MGRVEARYAEPDSAALRHYLRNERGTPSGV